MDIKDLTPEQIERAKACKSKADLVSMAESMGVELTPDQLDAIAGGGWDPFDCDSKGQPCHGYEPYSPPIA